MRKREVDRTNDNKHEKKEERDGEEKQKQIVDEQ